MTNKVRAFVTTWLFVLIGIPVSVGQDNFERRVDRIAKELLSKVEVPEPIEVRIYSKANIEGLAHFSTFSIKKLKKRPALNINKWFFANLSDKALTYVLAHELGHYFDSEPRLALSKTGFEFDGQFIADAFALYVIGEDLFKAGRDEMVLMYYYNVDPKEKWLMENDPTYYDLQLNYVRQRTNWWLAKAKQNLDKVPSLISSRNRSPINSRFKSTR
ncbi:MAG: hypothetical protein A2750_02450 [Candidatus Yanofskybacteria bacterium RIFCSPHIGHO2_01_FULL_45_42]|uniref:Uncharacterized protein n=2 Tax=Candidatus Yanofskyibacteriota TaxID=1752733 RepID=A0A1F8EYF3_9BACT|nr:MAG: hypothetical protein A2750_02450 [Candidatus Yanofskybacteria bacterium RIFCSPHIGHO2_01_FULL_45_42]OGN16290.1 MAG: hypothetical protein A3C81_00800 [Candidatus Yanofskybacteria bacterium RIFCSPHIGHO2_02_FULL_46_19]